MFIKQAMPFIITVINQKALSIPQEFNDQFKEKVKILLEKRDDVLARERINFFSC